MNIKSRPTFDGTQNELVNRPENLGLDQPNSERAEYGQNPQEDAYISELHKNGYSPFFPFLLHSCELPQNQLTNPRTHWRLVNKWYKCPSLAIFTQFDANEMKNIVNNLTKLAEREYSF